MNLLSVTFFTMKKRTVGAVVSLNTGTLRNNKVSLPCSVSTSNNYVILKASNRNIADKVTPVYNEKINLEVTVGLNYCSSEFNHINRMYYKFCISLLRLSLWTLGKLVSYFVEVISKSLSFEKSTMLKQWFLWCGVLRNHVITDNFGVPNCLCNVPVEDLGCLTCLLQNMAVIVTDE